MKLPKKITRTGFSLIEIMIVISIIAIVSGIGLSLVSALQKTTRDAQREADLRVLQSALQQYYADQNFYPNDMTSVLSSGGSLTSCTGKYSSPACTNPTKTYLSVVPKDPAGTPYVFQSLKNVTSAVNCDMTGGATTSNVCHFYNLCAKKENLAAGTYCGTYNFRVTPL